MSLNMRQDETVTFRIDSTLKAELNRLAAEQHQSLGALIRDLAAQRVLQERRKRFEAEADRQSRAIAAAAKDPSTDEYAVMRELANDLGDFSDEWR
jgi:predicted transcriptional regulator